MNWIFCHVPYFRVSRGRFWLLITLLCEDFTRSIPKLPNSKKTMLISDTYDTVAVKEIDRLKGDYLFKTQLSIRR